ncbi:protein Jade-2-like [Sinocyclocheilus anshuiensis]|uniref:protein Jade-2-like n=1 Tax=Sinocyclocheilus anshuiensis TaxID=1608454 RepID=UPI0007B87E42|nr:PREDICTED: protein Jade-2-like [Sinocyclocheilus anshuiensis]
MENEMKRRKYSTSSNDSDTTDSHVTTWSRSSKNTGTSSTWVRHEQKKPSEVFRTDFITAMKLPDSAQLSPEEFYFLSDPWRQEWEKGVQVPANVEAIPEPVVRMLPEVNRIPFFSAIQTRGQSEFGFGESHGLTEPLSCYNLDDLDVSWLELVNAEFRQLALPELDELTMEQVVVELENRCQQNMQQAIETEEGLGIEYDEDVVCDVCRSPEGEDGNEMVFCDKCNVCVHQACYGILKVPQGNWLCRICALGVQPKCLLCPRRGGALKPTRSGTKWVHVSCALWIPEVLEVSLGVFNFRSAPKYQLSKNVLFLTKEAMAENPAFNRKFELVRIPASRWALSCGLCREHTGTCIQCSMPSCIVAFHVTCAFDHGLEMCTTLAENDEVRFKSYCLEHSSVSRSNNSGNVDRPETRHAGSDLSGTHLDRSKQGQAEQEKASQRKQKLQELENEFYRFVDPKDVAESLSLPDVHVDFLFQYWKLRRKANFNQPLVALKRDEVDNLAQQEQDVLYRRLKLFTHLRQDLERVRNLCYMVTRREKIKHSLCNLQEKIFSLQIQLLEKDLAGDKTRRGEKIHRSGVRERVKERRKSSPEKKDKWRSDDNSLFTQLGFSKSFPLDGSLFDSWLAQSVHITADNMLSQWSLSGETRDPSVSLLSDQLLQGEESLLNLMMDHSIKSTWKTPQLGRKPRGAPRSRRKSVSLPRIGSTVKGKAERARHVHHHHTRSCDGRPDPLQPAISKMDSCHISEECGSCGFVAESGKRSQMALRLRRPRQGKSRSKSNSTETSLPKSTGNNTSTLDTETDGYFSDAEQSDSELRSFSRKLRLPQLHAGKEEVVRRSVLAS